MPFTAITVYDDAPNLVSLLPCKPAARNIVRRGRPPTESGEMTTISGIADPSIDRRTEGRPRLLLVDDEPLIRVVLADALEDAGFAITESGSGKEAIAHLEHSGFAAVVTDIRLGAGLNGWDVARSARQQDSHIAVVYMTGDSAADWATEGVPASVIVQKPFLLTLMITAVSSVMISAGQLGCESGGKAPGASAGAARLPGLR